jgi:hypothetical protein
VVSNGATAVKGAWSEAEGVHRSGAETLDGRGSGVARLVVGGGEGLYVLSERSERGDAGWEHAKRAGLRRRGAEPPKRRRVSFCMGLLFS